MNKYFTDELMKISFESQSYYKDKKGGVWSLYTGNHPSTATMARAKGLTPKPMKGGLRGWEARRKITDPEERKRAMRYIK